jgi:hypothetical protein
VSPARPELNGHFDLDAAAGAAIAEALDRPFRFSYHGELYELPNQKTWPLAAAAELAQNGDMEAFLDAIGAPGVYAKLAAAGLRLGEMNVLMDQAAEEAGVGNLPNSSQRARRASTRK